MTSIYMTRQHRRFSAAAVALELTARGLDRPTRLLIQLRASYLNNCSYCIDLHSSEARRLGWADERSATLRETTPGHWASTEFSSDEQLILEFTDIAVRLSEVAPEERTRVQARVVDRFGAERTGEIITAVVAINMWNRIAILSEK